MLQIGVDSEEVAGIHAIAAEVEVADHGRMREPQIMLQIQEVVEEVDLTTKTDAILDRHEEEEVAGSST